MFVRALKSSRALLCAFVVLAVCIAQASLPGLADARTTAVVEPQAQKPEPPSPAKAKLTLESLAGTWDGVAQTPNGDLPLHAVLTYQDGKLTGSIESQMGVSQITGAKLTEDVLELSFDLQGGAGTLSGKVAGEKYEGSWTYGADSGPFAVARVPPAQIKK